MFALSVRCSHMITLVVGGLVVRECMLVFDYPSVNDGSVLLSLFG